MRDAIAAFLLGFARVGAPADLSRHGLVLCRHDRRGGGTAASTLALTVWITYRSADRVARMMGPTGSRTITRLAAFLLLCMGVQIQITGVEDVLGPLLAQR